MGILELVVLVPYKDHKDTIVFMALLNRHTPFGSHISKYNDINNNILKIHLYFITKYICQIPCPVT